MYIGGWGVSPTGNSSRFVSCVRARVRARGAVCKVGFGKNSHAHALSLFPFGLAAFSLFPVE